MELLEAIRNECKRMGSVSNDLVFSVVNKWMRETSGYTSKTMGGNELLCMKQCKTMQEKMKLVYTPPYTIEKAELVRQMHGECIKKGCGTCNRVLYGIIATSYIMHDKEHPDMPIYNPYEKIKDVISTAKTYYANQIVILVRSNYTINPALIKEFKKDVKEWIGVSVHAKQKQIQKSPELVKKFMSESANYRPDRDKELMKSTLGDFLYFLERDNINYKPKRRKK
jgi:hypothetical protein